MFVGFLFLLFPMGKYAAYGETLFEFDGLELIFGYKSNNNIVLGFNTVSFIMFLLILAGIIIPTLSIKPKKYALIGDKITTTSNLTAEKYDQIKEHHFTCFKTVDEDCDTLFPIKEKETYTIGVVTYTPAKVC